MRKILFYSFVFLLSFNACKKKEDTQPIKKSKTELLTAHFWKLSSFTVNPPMDIDGNLVTDLLPEMDECTKDNLIKFNSDKTLTRDEGASKCDPSDPQIITDSNWSFNSDESSVIIDGEPLKLIELSDQIFATEASDEIDGVQYTYSIQYSKN